MKKIIVLLLIFSYATVQANDDRIWHEGRIVLANGEELTGEIRYDLVHEVVKLKDGDQIRAYGARQLGFFDFMDAKHGVKRTFYALPYASQGMYKRPTFFELLVDGKFALLAREKHMNPKQMERNWLVSWPVNHEQVMAHSYFMLNEEGEIRMINPEAIEEAFQGYEEAATVSMIMHEQQAKPQKRIDLIRIFMRINNTDTLV